MKLSELVINIIFVLAFVFLLMYFLMKDDVEGPDFVFKRDNVHIEQDEVVYEVDSTNNEVFVFVEDQPEYPGGDEARLSFLSKNIYYPEMAKESGIQGTVYVTFVIEKDGRVTNVKLLRGIGGGCDESAISAIRKMPKWKPGTQKGKAVRAQFNMPIRFILSDDSTEEGKSGS